jgi:2,4-didehydro-3-deoxy-L-rhamnonate hydrolase
MKLVRYGAPGHEKPGLIDDQGNLRDLSGNIADFTPREISPEGLKRLSEIATNNLPIVDGTCRYGPPLTGIGKFVAVGLNFADHAAEAQMPIPAEPIIFMKATTCIQGPDDPVMLPKDSLKLDWEVELGVVIGSVARYVEEARALDYVAGFVIVNDVSERTYQMERGGTWDKGKGCDTFGPIGPWLVTAAEVMQFDTLDMWLDVNGQRMQTGNTRTMIFRVPQLVSYISQFMTLMPGDLIATGTPPGVGLGKKPHPVYLNAGDVIRVGIAMLGEQRQIVVPFNLGAIR